jgi:hypothetical protein
MRPKDAMERVPVRDLEHLRPADLGPFPENPLVSVLDVNYLPTSGTKNRSPDWHVQ